MGEMQDMLRNLQAIENESKHGPSPDIAICSECGGRFKSGEYDLELESDGWEYQSYQVAVCRHCKDGGCIDDWNFSPEQWKKYEEWENEKIS